MSNIIQPRLVGRRTTVPHILLAPDIHTSVRLRILSGQLLDAARAASSSNRQLIEKMMGADESDSSAHSEFAGLFDELAVHSYDVRPIEPNLAVRKGLMEFKAMQQIERQGLTSAMDDDAAFLNLVFRIHRAVKGGGTHFRRGEMVIRPDAGGNLIVFPPWQHCEPLLRSLAALLREHRDASPALCAVIGYVGLIHAHPFRDANGRTARALFNIMIRQVSGTRHYLPISKVAAISRGGFLIKLRRALYGGEWEPLTGFFIDALRQSSKIQRVE